MKSQAIDISIAAVGSKTTYVGAGVTGLGWFLSNQFFGLMGVLIAVAGLLMNWHFKRRADQRTAAESEHRRQEREMRMDMMRRTGQAINPAADSDLGRLEFDE